MTRSVIRPVRWYIGPDVRPESPRKPIVEVSCTSCPKTSGEVDIETDAPEEWALQHVGGNPSHTGYRFNLTSFWHAVPMDGAVVAVEPPEATP